MGSKGAAENKVALHVSAAAASCFLGISSPLFLFSPPLKGGENVIAATAPSLIEANAAEHSIMAEKCQGGTARARIASGKSREKASLQAENATRCHLDKSTFSFYFNVKLRFNTEIIRSPYPFASQRSRQSFLGVYFTPMHINIRK